MASGDPTYELSTRAQRDLRKLAKPERNQVREALEALIAGEENVDVKPLVGRGPWRRLRTGEWRIIFRPLEAAEGVGVLVATVVNRRDLERAVRTLR